MNDNVLPFGNLTVDHGVELPPRPIPAGAGRVSEFEGYRAALSGLPVGDGFFVEGKSLKETNGLFNFAKSIGVFTARGRTDNDSVYGKAGVRFVRISETAANGRKREKKVVVAQSVSAPTSAQGDGQPQGAAQTADDDNEL